MPVNELITQIDVHRPSLPSSRAGIGPNETPADSEAFSRSLANSNASSQARKPTAETDLSHALTPNGMRRADRERAPSSPEPLHQHIFPHASLAAVAPQSDERTDGTNDLGQRDASEAERTSQPNGAPNEAAPVVVVAVQAQNAAVSPVSFSLIVAAAFQEFVDDNTPGGPQTAGPPTSLIDSLGGVKLGPAALSPTTQTLAAMMVPENLSSPPTASVEALSNGNVDVNPPETPEPTPQTVDLEPMNGPPLAALTSIDPTFVDLTVVSVPADSAPPHQSEGDEALPAAILDITPVTPKTSFQQPGTSALQPVAVDADVATVETTVSPNTGTPVPTPMVEMDVPIVHALSGPDRRSGPGAPTVSQNAVSADRAQGPGTVSTPIADDAPESTQLPQRIRSDLDRHSADRVSDPTELPNTGPTEPAAQGMTGESISESQRTRVDRDSNITAVTSDETTPSESRLTPAPPTSLPSVDALQTTALPTSPRRAESEEPPSVAPTTSADTAELVRPTSTLFVRFPAQSLELGRTSNNASPASNAAISGSAPTDVTSDEAKESAGPREATVSTGSVGTTGNRYPASLQSHRVAGDNLKEQQFAQRVTAAVQRAQQTNGQLKIRLHPPELGTLQIEVRMQQGVLTARLEVQTAAAHQALSEHAAHLRETLIQVGSPLERLDIQLADQRTAGSGLTRSDPEHQPSNQHSQQQRHFNHEDQTTESETELVQDGFTIDQLDIQI